MADVLLQFREQSTLLFNLVWLVMMFASTGLIMLVQCCGGKKKKKAGAAGKAAAGGAKAKVCSFYLPASSSILINFFPFEGRKRRSESRAQKRKKEEEGQEGQEEREEREEGQEEEEERWSGVIIFSELNE